MDLSVIRKNIDTIDAMIVTLLAKRADLVDLAGSCKKDSQAVRDPKRVEQVIEKVRTKAAAAGLDPEIAEKTYRTIIGCFVERELRQVARRKEK